MSSAGLLMSCHARHFAMSAEFAPAGRSGRLHRQEVHVKGDEGRHHSDLPRPGPSLFRDVAPLEMEEPHRVPSQDAIAVRGGGVNGLTTSLGYSMSLAT